MVTIRRIEHGFKSGLGIAVEPMAGLQVAFQLPPLALPASTLIEKVDLRQGST